MASSEDSTEEKVKVGNDIQDNDFISLSCFELLKWLIKRVYYPLLLFLLFYYVSVALDISWEGEWLELESEGKLQIVSQ